MSLRSPRWFAAQPSRLRGLHDLGAAGDGRERQPPGERFRGGDDVGHQSVMLASEHRRGAAEAGLDLIGDEQNTMLGADLAQLAQK